MKKFLIDSLGIVAITLSALSGVSCEGKLNNNSGCTGASCNNSNNNNNNSGSDGCGSGSTSTACNNDFSADTFLPWEGGPAYYSQWTNGPSSDQNYFPLSVWLQTPSNANRYEAIGINLFIGLYGGPTPGQLSTLATSNMPVFCGQDTGIFSDRNVGMIRGWTQPDEPDNDQPLIAPTVIVDNYNTMKTNDPSRPVMLNFGSGVAWDDWWGRGNRTDHPEDYVQYAPGGDILSYDIYPMNLDPAQQPNNKDFSAALAEVSQNIWYVPYGIDRLRQWTDYKKPVWGVIETTIIDDSPAVENHPPTPSTTKAEVWMSIIHGARGIMYFCHKITPFDETGLLDDPTMSAAVKDINSQVISLAPVINTQSVGNGVTTSSNDANIPVDTMLKRYNGYTYLFAVSMRPGSTMATFTLRDFPSGASAEVLGENRSISVSNGVFQDSFTDYSVHIYKIR